MSQVVNVMSENKQFVIWNAETRAVEAVVDSLDAGILWRETNGGVNYFSLEIVRHDYFLENASFYEEGF